MEGPAPPPPPPPEARQEQEQEKEQQQVTEAGAVRALIRASGAAYRTIVFGSLPRRVPVKLIGPLTDRLATAYDAVAALQEAHKEQQQQQQQQGESQQGKAAAKGRGLVFGGLLNKARGAWLQKAHLFGAMALSAAPNVVRSAALGTAVFELYESASEATTSLYPNPLPLPVTCTAAGAAAGACHGALYVAWEYGRVALTRLRALPRAATTVGPAVVEKVGGTTAAHALAHATLFGSFEVCKEGLFAITGAKHEEPLGVALVGIAGAVAGFSEEAVSHFTQSWEQKGVSSLRGALKRHGPPPLRVIARTAALPSAVGFLSFEYGREAILSKFKDDDDGDEG